MAEYSRVLAAAHNYYSRKLAKDTIQKRVLLAMMKKKGSISYKMGGPQYEWRVRFKEHAFSGIDDMETIEWSREDTYKKPVIGWREVVAHDVISRREVKLVRGKEQILRLYDDKMELLKEDWSNGFSASLWEDGEASGNTKVFHGIESIMADDAGAADGDTRVDTNDSYAGLSLALGNYGNVSGDPGYGWFSPYLSNSGYNSGSWAANAPEILRRAIYGTTFGNGPDQRPQLGIFNQASYLDFLNLIDGQERIIVQRGGSTSLVSMGFASVEFEGLPLTWDFDCPTSYSNPGSVAVQGYLWNFSKLKMAFCGDQSEICEGNVYYDENQRAYKFLVESLGNLIWREPKYFAKIATYA